MKNIMKIAAVAALVLMAGCQKESFTGHGSNPEDLVFTATIDQSKTKTTVNTDSTSKTRGKVSWETDDTITVKAGDKTAIYEIDKIEDGVATFKKRSGDNLPSSGVTYTATYGDSLTVSQNYSTTVTGLPMSATSETTSLTFRVTCGLLKLSLTASTTETEGTVSMIEVTGTPTGGAKTTYTLTCSPAVPISSSADFYMILPAGSYGEMVLYNNSGYSSQKTSSSGMMVAANKVQPVTMTGLSFNIRPTLLPGKFSVSAQKKVYFTRSNLYWDDGAFKLESSQTAYPTSWDTCHVSHFYWTKTAADSYAREYSGSLTEMADRFFADGGDAAHMLKVRGRDSLYVLSVDEWVYLFNTRTNASSLYKNRVTVNGVERCLVIAPDDYAGTIADSYDASAWATAEASGLVCFPPAGFRNGTDFYDQSFGGRFWSASKYTGYSNRAYLLYFLYYSDPTRFGVDTQLVPNYYGRCNYGCSVRLVRTVPAPPTTG